MTREEASKVLEMFLYKQCDLERTKFAYDDNTVWDAVKMASESLKQDSVLDKIKVEIESLSNANPSYWHSGDMVEREDVLQIIDKYKAENESQESDCKCHTCKHYTSGEYDGSCGSYICKHYSNWEGEG